MYLFSPVAYPTALLLDRLIGRHHGVMFEKASLKTLVSLHQGVLRQDEMGIVSAALEMNDKPATSIMTPLSRILSLSSDAVLDTVTRQKIVDSGYSRIPVHLPNDPANLKGILEVKLLGLPSSETGVTVGQLAILTLPVFNTNTSCLDVSHFFQQGDNHMALLAEKGGRAIGIVTMGDIMKELIGE